MTEPIQVATVGETLISSDGTRLLITFADKDDQEAQLAFDAQSLDLFLQKASHLLAQMRTRRVARSGEKIVVAYNVMGHKVIPSSTEDKFVLQLKADDGLVHNYAMKTRDAKAFGQDILKSKSTRVTKSSPKQPLVKITQTKKAAPKQTATKKTLGKKASGNGSTQKPGAAKMVAVKKPAKKPPTKH